MLNIILDKGDFFMIGDDIKITFSKQSGEQYTLLFDAPRDLKILRGKLHEEEIENIATTTGDIQAQILSEVLYEDNIRRKRLVEANNQKIEEIRAQRKSKATADTAI
jgi:sRNA-binding carbon storage regulator CsrA